MQQRRLDDLLDMKCMSTPIQMYNLHLMQGDFFYITFHVVPSLQFTTNEVAVNALKITTRWESGLAQHLLCHSTSIVANPAASSKFVVHPPTQRTFAARVERGRAGEENVLAGHQLACEFQVKLVGLSGGRPGRRIAQTGMVEEEILVVLTAAGGRILAVAGAGQLGLRLEPDQGLATLGTMVAEAVLI